MIFFAKQVSHVEGLGISPSKAALLIGFMSIASTISRVIFGKFSDHPKVNRLFMTQLAITGFGVTTTLCPVAKDYASLVTIVVFLGLFDGLYVVLIAVVNTDIVGVHKLSAALGSVYGVISITLTVGPPFAGEISAIPVCFITLTQLIKRSFVPFTYRHGIVHDCLRVSRELERTCFLSFSKGSTSILLT